MAMRLKLSWIVTLLASFLILMPLYAKEGPDFSSVVDKVGKSVVNVISDTSAEGKKLIPDELRSQLDGTPLMDVLKQLYGDKLDEKLSGKGPNIGSGCIISHDGYIVTNYHVIEGADKVFVLTQDRRQFPAKIVGYDVGTDIALLKIEANDLSYIVFSDSSKVKVGQWAIAIGTPFGFENTVTAGVVSALGRSLGTERYVPFIQSDVAVNPGNSGGPLLNMQGELIGINSQIISESGNFAGLSFAVPSNIVKNVVDQLKTNGNVTRGWIGVAFQDLDSNLALSFGLTKLKGALVSRVLPQSPASRAGIKIGDIITELNGKEIIRATDIPPIVGVLPIDSKVVMKVVRNHAEMSFDLVLNRFVPNEVAAANDKKAVVNTSAEKVRTGIIVRDPEDFEKASLDTDQQGVIVENVASKTWSSAGIRRGDMILSVNNEPIQDITSFYQRINKLKNDATTVPVLIVRQGEVQHYIAVKFEK